MSRCSQCSQWALRQWELPGHGNEQDLIPVSPCSPGLPWATLHPSPPRNSKWDPRESLPGRWVQPCPLSQSLFPWDRAPNPLHPSGAVVLRHCPQQVPDQALATGPHSTRSVWGGGGGIAAPRRSGHPPHRSPLDFPGWWAQAPIAWAPRSVEGIQIPPPSGFSTNNHPTRLWRIDEPLT